MQIYAKYFTTYIIKKVYIIISYKTNWMKMSGSISTKNRRFIRFKASDLKIKRGEIFQDKSVFSRKV